MFLSVNGNDANPMVPPDGQVDVVDAARRHDFSFRRSWSNHSTVRLETESSLANAPADGRPVSDTSGSRHPLRGDWRRAARITHHASRITHHASRITHGLNS